MPQIPYTPPSFGSDGFNCPHCHAYAHQTWPTLAYQLPTGGWMEPSSASISFCANCRKFALWVGKGTMVFPVQSQAPPAHADMPDAVRADYEEASDIVETSPRGAAALLRLVIQKLCVSLDQPGKDLNADIAAFVKTGLHPKIQKALDAVRVIGNESVHPGMIDVRDDPELAHRLFELVNVIVDAMISQPKRIDEIYGKLPEAKREAIKKRDS